MKSVKEKSEDYVSGFHPSIQRMCKESFEAGANYVLSEIENIVKDYQKNVQRVFGRALLPDVVSKCVLAAIEQLRSN